jgi:hypothetical protein
MKPTMRLGAWVCFYISYAFIIHLHPALGQIPSGGGTPAACPNCAIGVATGTSLALGGVALGSNGILGIKGLSGGKALYIESDTTSDASDLIFDMKNLYQPLTGSDGVSWNIHTWSQKSAAYLLSARINPGFCDVANEYGDIDFKINVANGSSGPNATVALTACPSGTPTLTPDAPNTIDLGSSTNPWQNIYGQDVIGASAVFGGGTATTRNLSVSKTGLSSIGILSVGQHEWDFLVGNTCMTCWELYENSGSAGAKFTFNPTTSVATLVYAFANPGILADSGQTDASVCEDTTNHQYWSGTGTAGLCLGTSSMRFKVLDGPLTSSDAEQVLRWQPIIYHSKPEFGDGGVHQLAGFSAEQMATVTPRLVSFDADGNANSVDYVGGVPYLTKMIQMQQARLDAIEACHLRVFGGCWF